MLLELPFDEAARRLPPTLAELDRRRTRDAAAHARDSLDWMARVLAGLDCGFTIRGPDELRTSVRELASRLAAVG